MCVLSPQDGLEPLLAAESDEKDIDNKIRKVTIDHGEISA